MKHIFHPVSIAAGLVLALVPPAAAADAAQNFACVFTLECYETEACTESMFEIDVMIAEGYADRSVEVISVAETMNGTAYSIGDGGWMANLGTDVGPALLTIHDTQGRMSFHGGTGAMMINYSGMCEGPT